VELKTLQKAYELAVSTPENKRQYLKKENPLKTEKGAKGRLEREWH